MSSGVALDQLSHLQNTPLKKFNCIDDAQLCLKQWADHFEVKHMAYLATDLAEHEPETSCLVTTYPNEWVQRYTERNYVAIDPVVKFAREQTRPFFWGRMLVR